MRFYYWLPTTVALLASASGCFNAIRRDTDRRVYQAIEQRQRDAIGATTDIQIRYPKDTRPRTDEMYSFTPHSLTAELPEGFRPNAAAGAEPAPAVTSEEAPSEAGVADDEGAHQAPVEPPTEEEASQPPMLNDEIFTDAESADLKVFGLRDALHYGMQHGRDLQNAKEDLYLAALDLTLERHLWTPQFASAISADFADFGQVRKFDRAMSAVADASVSQRLPLGGEITARMIGTLMRDLGRHITSGETGQVIIDANLPLFRGAGKVAYESRYAAERELIYAVRSYERFRRSFVVQVAGDYFTLQGVKASIGNTYQSYLSRHASWEKADFVNRMGRSKKISDTTRALSNLRDAESSLVERKEQFASSLDRFKILIGMSVDQSLDVRSQDDDPDSLAVETLLADTGDAVAVALMYRLDLLTGADRVEDARRGIVIAKNQILPDLDFNGSVTTVSDSNRKSIFSFNTERATWRASLDFQLDDRMTERNAYRQSLVTQRRAERQYELLVDTVRADVRRALRRIRREDDVRRIQLMNVDENAFRADAARAQFNLGKANNQDVIDADNEELRARDALAAAIASYRNAILQFRLDTGTLRVTDDGRWEKGTTETSP
ncbi:MAG: TolC family protein [Phycisphaerae bacterium]